MRRWSWFYTLEPDRRQMGDFACRKRTDTACFEMEDVASCSDFLIASALKTGESDKEVKDVGPQAPHPNT